MVVRCLIEVRAGVKWGRAMVAWVLMITWVVGWGVKAKLVLSWEGQC